MIKINRKPEQESVKQLLPEPDPSEQIENPKKILRESANKLAKSPNEKAAKNILKQSIELAAQYELRLFENFEQSFRANIELELWRTCFYSSIEALRKQSGSAGPHSIVFKQYLLELIKQAISFYEALLKRYELFFGVDFESYFRWPTDGFPPEDLAECKVSSSDPPIQDTIVLRSAQRHLVYLGDLHRYKVQNQDESDRKDYSAVRRYYLKASGLEPMNGQPFNQLAVVAFYNRSPVEMLFWYLRALSVRVPFEPARDSMEMVLNNFRDPAICFEKWYFEQMENKENGLKAKPKDDNAKKGGGPIIVHGKEKQKSRSKYIREIWIRPNEEQSQSEKGKEEEGGHIVADEKAMTSKRTTTVLEEIFCGENAKKMQKQAIQHLLNSAGILISNIDFEQFKRSSELVLAELSAFLNTDIILLTPLKLLEIVFIFAFSVHSSKSGSSETLIDEQKKAAMIMILSIFRQFLELICADADQIGLFLLTGKLSKKFSRTLPSLCFILSWICALLTHNQFASKSAELRQIILFHDVVVWSLLSRLCNKLQKMRESGDLNQCYFEPSRRSGCTHVILPELAVLSPLFNVLPKNPAFICLHLSIEDNANDLQFLAVHARFGLLLCLCERLATDESIPVMTHGSDGFAVISPEEQLWTGSSISQTKQQKSKSEEMETKKESRETSEGAETESQEQKGSEGATTVDESELKKKLLLDEQSAFEHQWIIEIRPKYLVPDTNTFIDHLGQVQLLAQCGLFTVLVPTIVLDELSCLTLGVPIAPGVGTILSRELLNPEGSRSRTVMQRAKAAVEWLREAAEKRMANISSATSNGNILHKLTFAIEGAATEQAKKKSNDDLILSGCIKLCEKLEKSRTLSCTSAESTTIERMVVLLTEDRGLSAKAEAERIPVRTMPHFTQWALRGGRQHQKQQKGEEEEGGRLRTKGD